MDSLAVFDLQNIRSSEQYERVKRENPTTGSLAPQVETYDGGGHQLMHGYRNSK